MTTETISKSHPKDIWKYLAWTFGWSWGIWLLLILLQALSLEFLLPWLMPVSIIASFGPALGAKMALGLSFRELWGYIFSRRPKAWLPLILLMVMETLTYSLASEGWNSNRPFWLLPILFIFVLVCGGGNEELGWRGFLQPALEKRFSFWQATVLTGLAWIVWHVPLWFMPGSNQAGTSFLVFIADVLIISFVFAGLYKHSRSIWYCCLLHAFNNTIAGSFVREGFNYIIYFVGIGLMAVYAVWLWYRADVKNKEEE